MILILSFLKVWFSNRRARLRKQLSSGGSVLSSPALSSLSSTPMSAGSMSSYPGGAAGDSFQSAAAVTAYNWPAAAATANSYYNYGYNSALPSSYTPVSPSYKPAKLEIDQAMAQWAAASQAMSSSAAAEYNPYSGFFSTSSQQLTSGGQTSQGGQSGGGGGHYPDLRYPASSSQPTSSHRN